MNPMKDGPKKYALPKPWPIWMAPRDGTTILLHLSDAPESHRTWRGWWRGPDKHVPDGCWMLKSYGKCNYQIAGWTYD